jgi:hypothetical protein
VSLETNMPEAKHDSILDVIVARPWWVSLTIAAAAYAALRFVPPLLAGHPHLAEVGAGIIRVAPPLAIMFAAVVPVALMSNIRRRRMAHDGDALNANPSGGSSWER